MVLGTAGHIDHGKSSLVAALTGVHPDRLPEEKRRGITTDLGFGHLTLGSTAAGIVDVPGHERFVRTMIAGAGGMDAVLLVVAADSGVQPQTREHLAICQLLGMRRGVIALTKCDRATAAQRAAALSQLPDLVAHTFLAAAPVLEVSALTGEGLPALRHALAACAPARDTALLARPFRLPVDRSFSLAGFGTVATGTLAQGSLEAGAEVELVGAPRRLRLRGLQVHGRPAMRAQAGERTAVNLVGIEAAGLRRGDTLAEPGVFSPVQTFVATLELLPGAELPARVHCHLFTAERVAAATALGPGLVRIKLTEPTVAAPGDRFILRQLSPALTLGGGRVIELDPPRQSRAAQVAFARELVSAHQPVAIHAHLRRAGAAGLPLAALARALALRPSDVEADLEAALPPAQVRIFGRPARAVLAEFAPRLAPAALGPDAAQLRLQSVLEARFRQAGLAAPPAAELLRGEHDPGAARAAVTALARQGRLVAIHPGHYLHAEAVAALRALLAAHKASSPSFSVADFKQWTALSRKFVIPLLEYLDRERLTRRRGERREIGQ